jgi:hypothetical protein
MDPTFSGLPNFINNAFSTNSNQYPDLLNEYNKINVPSPDLSFPGPDLGHTDFPPPATVAPAAEPFALSSEDGEFSETVLKYIGQILMEENIEDKPCLFYDPLGLQVIEKSFYDALGQKHASSVSSGGGEDYGIGRSSFSKVVVPGDYDVFQPNLPQNIFSGSESMLLQFRRGLEEASKFLPRGNQLVSPEWKDKRENSQDGLRGRKNHEREDVDVDVEEGRSNKQSAVYVEESELPEMFDKVWLSTEGFSLLCSNKIDSGGKSRAKKQGKKKEMADLRSLLIQCAQAVSAADNRTAVVLLTQIRQHSSPYGEGSQRLAHFFANGLEARLAGTGTGAQIFYSSFVSKRISASEILKAYKVYLSACPFKMISLFFTAKMICKVAEKSTSLHIIDFGIQYGFHWPILIHQLSKRAGGPPKLRITGIEFPKPGFRPTESIEETGRRLAKYCERFNVPFEYHALASQNWETIQIEDLKIDRKEMLAVNCLYRFKNLFGETVEETSPRDAVLDLIRRLNPDIFVHSIVNGSYNSPFFVRRFREALFHFSSLYDIFDVNLSCENQERVMFEREVIGREAMNVVACEGLERVERPETYKQWQVRTIRAGFQQLPLDQELMTMFRSMMKEWHHKDFVLDEDNHWMLQGWKGRIVDASSCWVPCTGCL